MTWNEYKNQVSDAWSEVRIIKRLIMWKNEGWKVPPKDHDGEFTKTGIMILAGTGIAIAGSLVYTALAVGKFILKLF